MKKQFITAALLFSLVPLSACNPNAPEWLGGEPKRPAADVKIGPRRAPALNNQTLQSPPPPQENSGLPNDLPPLPNAKAKACVRRWTGYHDPGWTIG